MATKKQLKAREANRAKKAAAMSVSDRRAAAKSAGQSLSDFKAGVKASPSPSPSPSPSQSVRAIAKERAEMSVKDRRDAQDASGVSMQDFKQGKDVKEQRVNQNVSAKDYDYNKFRTNQVNNSELLAMREQGLSREEIAASAKASGLKIGAAAERRMGRWADKAAQAPTPTPTPTPNPNPNPNPNPTPTPTPSPYDLDLPNPGSGGNTNVEVENTQEQVVNQDNDQTSTIVGDNNNVNQNQDNSIDQLGGNNATTVNGGTSTSDEEAQSLLNTYVGAIGDGSGGGNLNADIENTQSQEVTQDNDQTSTITGDNNTVWQNQDNSVRQYGGDNRSFVYNGSGSGSDTPVSAATMGGFYDVDDSPAAQAKFNDLHTTLNRDNQKRFAGMGMKTAGMFSGFNAASFDPATLQSRIDQSTLRSFDQATIKDNDVFGDRDLYRGLLSGYNFGKPPKAVDDDDDD